MRTIEVTVNEKDNSYNQHIHAMMCFESSYFRGKENYLTHNDWQVFWKKSMKLDYDPNEKGRGKVTGHPILTKILIDP